VEKLVQFHMRRGRCFTESNDQWW